ncbi:MAG: PilZ domain-containing protein [Geobacter sp.]|nr:MAG: PilZ domain-containing protein [Geobacter sp.]
MEEEKKNNIETDEQRTAVDMAADEKTDGPKKEEQHLLSDSAADEKKEDLWNYDERRGEARKKISLKKTFPAELQLDALEKTYLYIADISYGGMKIITELNLPSNRTFILRIFIEATVEFPVEVVWQRQLVGYMNAYGLKFVALTPDSYRIIENFVSKYAIDTSKRNFRLNKMVSLQIMRDEEWITFYSYILNMSPHGFEYTTDYVLPLNDEFELRSFLIQGESPILSKAKILFSRGLSMGRTKGWLEFSTIDEKNKLRLTEYIDRLLQGEPPLKVYATLQDFEIPEYKQDTEGSGEQKITGRGEQVNQLLEDTEEAEGDDKSWIP